MKILNLYAGIGGNRRLWQDVEVTAVEYNESIAAIYKDLYPNDNVIVGDAHEYLLKNINEYDFIWASPPCPTHSKLGLLNYNLGHELKYPDMKLYQEIIVLQNFCKSVWVVENVKSYYEPLIRPYEAGRHYFWSNFRIGSIDIKHTPIKGKKGLTSDVRMKQQNYEILDFHGFDGDKRVLFKNCVDAELGEYILDCAMGVVKSRNVFQPQLF
jgi:DNA (cytosine-5)-methyltransferase 1